jgi:hypothetical protein
LGKISQLFSPNFKGLLARRENGSNIYVSATELGKIKSEHSFASIGTPFVNLTFEEKQKRGTALLYWEQTQERLVLSSIKTADLLKPWTKRNMPPGAGTIVLTWLCALAAQAGTSFEVFHVQNPQILRILMRDILSPEQTTLEYCHNVEDEKGEGFEILQVEHGLKGEFQFNRHPHSTFTNIKGVPHPKLLASLAPYALRFP